MKKIYIILLALCLMAASCSRVEVPEGGINYGYFVSSTITGACKVDYSLPEFATKALIDQVTTQSMQANFLRIDEDIAGGGSNDGLYTFNGAVAPVYSSVNWEQSYVLEALVISSPDNTDSIYYRSISFDPVQSYKIIVEGTEVNPDTTHFYHTRMVGWYPKNCTLPRTEGKAAYTKFDNTFSASRETEIVPIGTSDKRVGVIFKDLDGSKDVMMSNVKEGQYWHSHGAHKGSDSIGTKDIYRTPFGHNTSSPTYSNYFEFKHYLTGIRVWAFAEQSEQNLNMWGQITNVVLQNQPHTCKIWLPENIDEEWGEVYNWSDKANNDIICTPMFGDDTNHSSDNYTATYPISISGAGTADDKIYLGYSLVRPESTLSLELHTTNGVYVVNVPATYMKADSTFADIFKAGYIYDVMLNLQTSGSIAVLLENESNEHFFDLTTRGEFDDGGQKISFFKHANCYIVSPNDDAFKRDSAGIKLPYDGFCFSATTVGNDQAGILSYGSQTMYPTSATISPSYARLVWESSLGLISDIELLYGYVRFRVPDTSKEGNAVIAVYDNSNKLLWSWHIWITDPPLDQSFILGGTTYTFLDRNLGATQSRWTGTADALETYGLYYQWGRKDPSMGPSTYNYSQINLICADYYDFASEKHTAAEVRQFAEPTLKDGIENPMYLILPTGATENYSFNWLYDRNNILWGYNSESASIVKTIYDPCPYGYRVSANELNVLFSSSSYNLTDYGQIHTVGSTDFYFPYTGYKGVDKGLNSIVGEWKYVGRKADYQSAIYSTASGEGQYHRSRIYLSKTNSWTEAGAGTYSRYITSDYTNRRTAAPVRCVKNESHGLVTTEISLNPPYLIIGDTISINTYARSNEVSMLSTNLVWRYQLSTEAFEREDTLFKVSGNTVLWNNTYNFPVPTASFISSTTGNYSFIFTATNEYGVTSTAVQSASLATKGVTYTGYSPHLEGASGPVTGQPVDVTVRIDSDAPLNNISSVKINGSTATQGSGYNSSSVYSLSYTANCAFTSSGNLSVPVVMTYNGGSSDTSYVEITVDPFLLKSVSYDWTRIEAAGPLVNQPVTFTIKSNSNNISATINNTAVVCTTTYELGNYVTQANIAFPTSGDISAQVKISYGAGLETNVDVVIPVYRVAIESQVTSVSFDPNIYYVIQNQSYTSTYLALNTGGTSIVAGSLGYSALFKLSSNVGVFNVSKGQYLSGYDSFSSFSDNLREYTITWGNNRFRIYSSSGYNNYYWKQNNSGILMETGGNYGNRNWSIYKVNFVKP